MTKKIKPKYKINQEVFAFSPDRGMYGFGMVTKIEAVLKGFHYTVDNHTYMERDVYGKLEDVIDRIKKHYQWHMDSKINGLTWQFLNRVQ